MTSISTILRQILLILSLLSILMCPALYIAGEFFTHSLQFLEPVVCPEGMYIARTTNSISDPRGNATASNLVCTDGREEVDITARMLILLFGVGIIGVVMLAIWALSGPSKEPDVPDIKNQ